MESLNSYIINVTEVPDPFVTAPLFLRASITSSGFFCLYRQPIIELTVPATSSPSAARSYTLMENECMLSFLVINVPITYSLIHLFTLDI